MFIQNQEAIKYCKNTVELWENRPSSFGSFENRQLLKKYKDGTWILSVNVAFNKFNIPLQEQQARSIISGDLGNVYRCQIVEG